MFLCRLHSCQGGSRPSPTCRRQNFQGEERPLNIDGYCRQPGEEEKCNMDHAEMCSTTTSMPEKFMKMPGKKECINT
jgi:hypothetical protein